MRKLRIGLDFDGVIADTPLLKSQVARDVFEKEVNPAYMLAKYILDNNILTPDEYHRLQQEIYFDHPEWHRTLKPMKEACESITALKSDGHEIVSITSRTPDAVRLAREWLQDEGFGIELYDMEGRSGKEEVAKELRIEVYIDDDPQFLTPMVGVVPHLFLFAWKYNENFDEGDCMTRTGSWSDIRARIKDISETDKD